MTTNVQVGQEVCGGGLRRRLLVSHFTIALFSLMILIATVSSVVWLRSCFLRFTTRDLPTLDALNALDAGVRHSEAALTAWVITGSEKCREDREFAWKNEIRPARRALLALVESSGVPRPNDHLQKLDRLLEDLNESEWWVEDIAHAPGNEPAEDTTNRVLTPITHSILRDISSMIEEETPRLASEAGETLLPMMADLRGSFTLCWATLSRFVANGRPSHKAPFFDYLAATQRQVDFMMRRQELLNATQRLLLAAIDDNIRLFARYADKVVAMRESDRWNVVRHLLDNETIPIAYAIHIEVGRMATRRSAELESSSERIRDLALGTVVLVVVLGGVLVVATAITSIWNARKLSQPITALAVAADEMANGDLERDLPVPGDDEIGHLTRAFNVMRNRLATSSAERKQAQTALRESHEYVKNIIGSMINSLIVVAPDDSIVTVNEATCKLLGYREEELIGQPASLLFLEDEKEEGQHDRTETIAFRKVLPVKGTMLRTLISVGHVDDVEGWYAAKDGRRIPMSFSGSVMRDRKGEIQGIVCVAQDSTERKQLQCELAQAQKLESVGQLAAGIAHEINTPTQYVGDNTRFLKEAFGDINAVLNVFEKLLQAAKDSTVDERLVAEVEATLQQADVEYLTEEIPQAIDQSLDGVDRVAKIVRAMKEFSHPGTVEKSPINLAEAIETTITVAHNEWKYVAEMVTRFDPELPQVSCLPGELNQVILNLIVNAAHAIGDALGDDGTQKGTITVGTRRDGEWAEIFVRDTGTGIPDDVRARIFDPFFTTKGVGKGTGQGLAIARSVVVDKHGGAIDCETEPGEGTIFIIRLPIDGERQTQGAGENEGACSVY